MLVLVLVLSGVLWGGVAQADPYYNSTETCTTASGCLVSDDFEDQTWYVTDCDTSGGPASTANDGWCGTIDANPITPSAAILCGTGVTPFGNCVANGGQHDGTRGSVNQASHFFKTSGCGTTGAQVCEVNEIYVRWYAKWASGYLFSGEKHMNPTGADGDIAFLNIQMNCGTGSRSSTADVALQVLYGSISGTGISSGCNKVDNLSITGGRWYFFELHLKVGSSAVVELWANDCGTTGLSGCVSGVNTPTKRVTATGNLPGNGARSQIGTVWLENWASNGLGGNQDGSLGTGPYWDNLKVTRTGPIGFSGSTTPPPDTTPPAPPTGISIVKMER